MPNCYSTAIFSVCRPQLLNLRLHKGASAGAQRTQPALEKGALGKGRREPGAGRNRELLQLIRTPVQEDRQDWF